MAKFTVRESLQLGIGMVSRGEVGLIIAKIGIGAGFITNELFSAIVAMILATTVVTPPLLRWSFSSKQNKPVRSEASLESSKES
jgi:Kef-type K+ transport system membrane component KefB